MGLLSVVYKLNISVFIVLYSQRLELTRVAVVDPSLQVVYDTFVKPDEELIDYNTRYASYKGFVFQIIEHSTCSLSFSLGTFTGVNFRAWATLFIYSNYSCSVEYLARIMQALY